MEVYEMERDLATIKQFSERYPAFTPGALRALHFRQASNGMLGAFLKLGGRTLIDVPAFWALFDGAATTARRPVRRLARRRAAGGGT
jgi:hypothetical protein